MTEEQMDYETQARLSLVDHLRTTALSAQDVKSEIVEIPEWGEDWRVEVRGMTSRQRGDIYRDCSDEKGEVDAGLLYQTIAARLTFVPGTGERVFRESDIEELGAKSTGPISQIAEVALRLSGLTGVGELKKGLAGAE